DLAIDDARVEALDRVVAEPQSLDRAGRHVLDGDVGRFDQGTNDLEPARRLQVQGHRLFVGVELVEVPGVVVGFAGLQPAAGITGVARLDLHHFGAKPGEGFRAGRPGLELGEVDDANILETVEFDTNVHRFSPVALAHQC